MSVDPLRPSPSPPSTLPPTGRTRMLAALRLEPVDRPPVWFMRQAGRHLPGYRALRERATFLDLCREEDLCVRASAEPWRRYGVDAAIIFNDILIPLRDMGLPLDFDPGPRLARPIRSAAEAQALATPEYGPHTDVCRCLAALRSSVGESASPPAVLGFIGAPFTVAAYAIAGPRAGASGALAQAAIDQRETFEALQATLTEVLVAYARAQARAGADAIQIFESSAAALPPALYRQVGWPWLQRTIAALRATAPDTPLIVFGRGLHDLAAEIAEAGATAISLDETRPLDSARRAIRARGLATALQGNLRTEALRAGPDAAAAEAEALLARWRSIVPWPERARSLGPTGWVFNLGHGVPADASPQAVQAAVDAVREFDFALAEHAPRQPLEPAR